MTPHQLLGCAICFCSFQAWPVWGQEAILPQGDPRLRAEDAAAQKETRDSRMKQQGQGSNYRVDGERPPSAGKSSRQPGTPKNSVTRQDTGIEDPTVNPGQSSGMQTVQGRIITSKGNTHIVRQLSGMDATVIVDGRTAGDKDLHPGDVVTGTITSQGRAVAIHKEAR